MAGPLVGATGELGEAAIGTAAETYAWLKDPKEGRDGEAKSWNEQTHAGRKAVRIAKRYTPGTNTWYARKAAEVMLWDQLQYLFDDNAEQSFAAIERDHAKEGRAEWWKHGELLPDRAPDFDVMRPRDPEGR